MEENKQTKHKNSSAPLELKFSEGLTLIGTVFTMF